MIINIPLFIRGSNGISLRLFWISSDSPSLLYECFSPEGDGVRISVLVAGSDQEGSVIRHSPEHVLSFCPGAVGQEPGHALVLAGLRYRLPQRDQELLGSRPWQLGKSPATKAPNPSARVRASANHNLHTRHAVSKQLQHAGMLVLNMQGGQLVFFLTCLASIITISIISSMLTGRFS